MSLLSKLTEIKDNINSLIEQVEFDQFINDMANGKTKVEVHNKNGYITAIINDKEVWLLKQNGSSQYYGWKGDIIRWENVGETIKFESLPLTVQKAIFQRACEK